MNRNKRKALESAGFRVGDAGEFLGLTDEERKLVELRLALSRAVRVLRRSRGLTQQQLANRLKSSQSRVAKIESAASDVSLDLLFRSLFAVGGTLKDIPDAGRRGLPGRRRSRASADSASVAVPRSKRRAVATS